MEHAGKEPLRILVCDGRQERLDEVVGVVTQLGHEVVARQTDLESVGQVTKVERPDVAIVIVGESSQHSLQLIEKIVNEAACPVIAVLDMEDSKFVNEAAARGIFAYIAKGDAERLQSAMDIVLRRFAEYHSLEGAFVRRATLERAKGVLMERHSIDQQEAFEMLRDESRRHNRKIVEVADSVVASHRLLPRERSDVSEQARRPAPE